MCVTSAIVTLSCSIFFKAQESKIAYRKILILRLMYIDIQHILCQSYLETDAQKHSAYRGACIWAL